MPGHLAPCSVDVDQRVDGIVILAAPVAREATSLGQTAGASGGSIAAFEVEGRAAVGEAVCLEPRDPRRVVA